MLYGFIMSIKHLKTPCCSQEAFWSLRRKSTFLLQEELLEMRAPWPQAQATAPQMNTRPIPPGLASCIGVSTSHFCQTRHTTGTMSIQQGIQTHWKIYISFVDAREKNGNVWSAQKQRGEVTTLHLFIPAFIIYEQLSGPGPGWVCWPHSQAKHLPYGVCFITNSVLLHSSLGNGFLRAGSLWHNTAATSSPYRRLPRATDVAIRSRVWQGLGGVWGAEDSLTQQAKCFI